MAGQLAGRIAIVTGSGKGIGRATALRFAKEGAKVVVATRSAAPGQGVVDRITAAGGEALLIATDIGSRATVIEVVAKTVDHFGGIDIVVHNAAALGASTIDSIGDEELEQMLAVNVKACFWFAAAAMPYLEKSKAARLLVTSSITGTRVSVPGYTAYGTSKAGVNGFIRQAATELAPRGIRVNGVEPGITTTESALEHLSEEQLAAFRAMIPLAKAATPEDIAGALLYLAADSGDHITGQTIIVDGGQSLP